MVTSLVNFSNVSEIADRQATSICKNIEYAVHKNGIMTTFIQQIKIGLPWQRPLKI